MCVITLALFYFQCPVNMTSTKSKTCGINHEMILVKYTYTCTCTSRYHYIVLKCHEINCLVGVMRVLLGCYESMIS